MKKSAVNAFSCLYKRPVRQAQLARIFTIRTERVIVRTIRMGQQDFCTRETELLVKRGKADMKKRFVSPRSKNHNQLVEVLSKDFRGTFVKVCSTGKKFYCNGKNLHPITNKDLLC